MSILKQENIVRLISVANEMKGNDEDKDKLVLRSTILPHIFYEICKLNTDTFIFVNTVEDAVDVDHSQRLFCCWANGDVVQDGIWLKELEDCLPYAYQRMCRIYHQMKADNNGYNIRMIDTDMMNIAKLNNQFLTHHIFSQSDVLEFYNSYRFRY
jgi:hypothetical protein